MIPLTPRCVRPWSVFAGRVGSVIVAAAVDGVVGADVDTVLVGAVVVDAVVVDAFAVIAAAVDAVFIVDVSVVVVDTAVVVDDAVVIVDAAVVVDDASVVAVDVVGQQTMKEVSTSKQNNSC